VYAAEAERHCFCQNLLLNSGTENAAAAVAAATFY